MADRIPIILEVGERTRLLASKKSISSINNSLCRRDVAVESFPGEMGTPLLGGIPIEYEPSLDREGD